MKEWIIVAVLYGLGMGCFHLLGGIRAAGEALRSWGRATAGADSRPSSASS
jgi:hypothetical protein